MLAISDAVSGNRGDRDMVYDDVNRLTSATSPMFGTATYTYDVGETLRHVTVTGGTQVRDQDYVYDQNNRLTNITSGGATVVGLGYDVQGNLANKSGVTYTFDYGNRLRAGGPETYRYDVQGRRARSNSSAGLVYSLYAQSGQLLFQRDERSGKRRQYVYLGGSLVAESDVPLAGGTATVTYQHTDALGSPVATTNSAKTVLQRSEYEPYGYLLNRPMQDGPGYTGHITDAATGLVYMQQRYYDPLIPRFLSVDPVTAYDKPMTNFNRYVYALNNPYRFSDPDGRDSVGEMIDSAAEGCGAVSCAGWAIARGAWGVFGAEGVSQVYDKGAGASTGDKVMAGIEVSTLGVGGKVGAGIRSLEGVAQFARVVRAERLVAKIATMGKEGSKGIREVAGTAKDARKMFDTLRAGNEVKEVKPGVFTAEGANGGTVTFRAESKSGPATIDVNGIVDGIRKIKFLE